MQNYFLAVFSVVVVSDQQIYDKYVIAFSTTIYFYTYNTYISWPFFSPTKIICVNFRVFFLKYISYFSEQCHNLISTTYKTSCKTGKGLEEMFSDIALQLVDSNRSRIELQTLDHNSFKITQPEPPEEPHCSC